MIGAENEGGGSVAKKNKDKRRGDTWVGRRPAIYKDRKKEQNRQGEQKRPKHKKDYRNEE